MCVTHHLDVLQLELASRLDILLAAHVRHIAPVVRPIRLVGGMRRVVDEAIHTRLGERAGQVVDLRLRRRVPLGILRRRRRRRRRSIGPPREMREGGRGRHGQELEEHRADGHQAQDEAQGDGRRDGDAPARSRGGPRSLRHQGSPVAWARERGGGHAFLVVQTLLGAFDVGVWTPEHAAE